MKEILFYLLLFFISISTAKSQTEVTCVPYQNETLCIIVIDSNTYKNKLSWANTLNVGTVGFIIYKETGSNVYDSIGYVGFSMASKFIDYSSSPEMHSDRYKMCVVDSCGNLSQKSPYHQTIHLQVTQGYPSTTILLNWTKYIDESGVFTPSKYYIYRGSQPDALYLLDSVSGSQSTYTDLNVFSTYYYGVKIRRDISCHVITNVFANMSNVTKLGMNIYPNPLLASSTVAVDYPVNSDYRLIIYDISGKVVRTYENLTRYNYPDGASNKFKMNIERGDLMPGLYFMELSGDRVYKGKLMIN